MCVVATSTLRGGKIGVFLSKQFMGVLDGVMVYPSWYGRAVDAVSSPFGSGYNCSANDASTRCHSVALLQVMAGQFLQGASSRVWSTDVIVEQVVHCGVIMYPPSFIYAARHAVAGTSTPLPFPVATLSPSRLSVLDSLTQRLRGQSTVCQD